MLSARQKPEVFCQDLLEVADLLPQQIVREGLCSAEERNWSFLEIANVGASKSVLKLLETINGHITSF
jgi:hypothetical protein